MKLCSKCRKPKDAEKDFPWRKKDNCPDAWCHDCHKEANRERYYRLKAEQ